MLETYTMDVACTNCGHIEMDREINKGTTISEVDCDNCGCESLYEHVVKMLYNMKENGEFSAKDGV